jgi:hypothetical protein
MISSSTIMRIWLRLEVMLKNAEFYTIVSKNLGSRLVPHLGKRGNFLDQHLQSLPVDVGLLPTTATFLGRPPASSWM